MLAQAYKITEMGFRWSHLWQDSTRLEGKGDTWLRPGRNIASSRPEHPGSGTLSQAANAQCDDHFNFQKTKKHKRGRCRIRVRGDHSAV